MRYYVVADVHGFFGAMKSALEKQGFFEDPEPHKLIICGDLFDRGTEALQLQEFVLDLMGKDQIILIRGNHEDLTLQLLHGWPQGSHRQYHHHSNGTIDSVLQLTGKTLDDLLNDPESVGRAFMQTPYIQKIIPAMVDYYEAGSYIFTHGWIPCMKIELSPYKNEYVVVPDWREADETLWNTARWVNGMEAAHNGGTVADKTIVCGHWHCSFGHANYEYDGGEFDNHPNFTPYCGDGIIALDACTVKSGFVNCIIVEDVDDGGAMQKVYAHLEESRKDISAGRTQPADVVFAEIQRKLKES